MHSRNARYLSVLAAELALGAWVGSSAHAQAGAYQIQYDAPGNCPADAAFRAEIRARTPRLDQPPPDGGRHTYAAKLREDGSRFVGELTITDPDGTSGVRQVVGDRCDDAASALALIIAIGIDPNASTAPAPAAPPSRRPPTRPQALPPQPSPPPPAAPRVVAPSPVRPASWAWSAAFDGLLLGGVAPDPSLGAAIGVEAAPPAGRAWSPAFRVGLAYADNALTGGADRDAAFQWIAVPLALRLLNVRFGERVWVAPWLTADMGVIRARGRAVAEPQQQTRLWLDVAATGRTTVTLGHGWFVEGSLSAVVPIARHAFVFEEPRILVYDIPAVTWRAGLGGGTLIP